MSRKPNGFSLIELLICVFIIALLLQLALPAVQASREAGNRAACLNNLRQVGMAFHNYESALGELPVGARNCCNGTWLLDVLPYVEEEATANLYKPNPSNKKNIRYYSPINRPVTTQAFPIFSCPSDKSRYTDDNRKLSKHSYAVNYGNTGTTDSKKPADWDDHTTTVKEYGGVQFAGAPFYIEVDVTKKREPVKFSQIKDGLSNTLFASEVIQTKGHDYRGVIWYAYTAGFQTYLGPNSPEPDVTRSNKHCHNKESFKNPPCTIFASGFPMTAAARSRHPNGVNALKGDGAAEFYSEDISLEVWRALSTTQGGEL